MALPKSHKYTLFGHPAGGAADFRNHQALPQDLRDGHFRGGPADVCGLDRRQGPGYEASLVHPGTDTGSGRGSPADHIPAGDTPLPARSGQPPYPEVRLLHLALAPLQAYQRRGGHHPQGAR